ncbi:MAG: hypothetical protein Greene041679_31 [Parcubacteria group bacterium Greene0416_79]|nr:MAG: hypothetical protein Greene041679_31 [Parcubacteria group bacterium Greene0416_79]
MDILTAAKIAGWVGGIILGLIALIFVWMAVIYRVAKRNPTPAPSAPTPTYHNPEPKAPKPEATDGTCKDAHLITSHVRPGTLFVMCVYLAGSFVAIWKTTNALTVQIGFTQELQEITIGFTTLILWLLSFIPAFPLFVKTVGEYTAHVTNDLISGDLRIYGPGSYVLYPWEQTKPKNIVSLERVTIELRGTLPARVSGAFELNGSIRYYATLVGAAKHIGMDETTIKRGFLDIFLHDIGEIVSRLTPDEVLENVNLIQRAAVVSA